MTEVETSAVCPLGTRISGRIVIAYEPKQTVAANGTVPHGVGIAMDTRPGAYHPYVVWTMYTHDDGTTWGAESGDYCVTLADAMARMAQRS